MNIIHGISDIVLALVSLYVFFKYINVLKLSTTILWESFILSVALSAFFGALGFWGWDDAIDISQFFQKLATINGGIGLVAASYALATGNHFPITISYAIIAIGFIFFAFYDVLGYTSLYFWIPVICMSLVALLGLYAITRTHLKAGIWIVVGVLFFAIGSFRKELWGTSEFDPTLYHLLMSAGVLSIGMANTDWENA